MIKNYRNFSTNDFIADDYFRKWVQQPDEETNQFWSQWISMHPEKRSNIRHAADFIGGLQFGEDLPDQKQLEQSLQSSIRKIDEQNKLRRRRMFRKMVLVSMGLMLVGVLAVFVWEKYFVEEVFEMKLTAGSFTKRKLSLPDGSVVELMRKSGVRYFSDFKTAEKREIWLDGSADFNIIHRRFLANPDQPFIVHADKLDIQVAGTSFRVKKEDSLLRVVVLTGEVRVSLKDNSSFHNLKGGDVAEYSDRERTLSSKSLVEDTTIKRRN